MEKNTDVNVEAKPKTVHDMYMSVCREIGIVEIPERALKDLDLAQSMLAKMVHKNVAKLKNMSDISALPLQVQPLMEVWLAREICRRKENPKEDTYFQMWNSLIASIQREAKEEYDNRNFFGLAKQILTPAGV